MELTRNRFANHTEIAYREAVSKLKYLLAETYTPRIAIARPIISTSRRSCKETLPVQTEECSEDADSQSALSDFSKKEPSLRTTKSYYSSRGIVSNFPAISNLYSCNNERLQTMPPAELLSFIERQEEYIEQLERESQYCKGELKNLIDKVREVVAENEALHQDKSKHQGPSIVFSSRISELEAQLTAAKLELRQARDANSSCKLQSDVDDTTPCCLSTTTPSLQQQLELERALRERREAETRADELGRELSQARARSAELEAAQARAHETAQQAELERARTELELRRAREEIERRQDKLRDALTDTNRRIVEEKQQVERSYSQQLEQLSADVAQHWEAASKSHLESEKQRRQIEDLKRELAQKVAYIDDLKRETVSKTSKLQEELNQAIAEKDASQEEVSAVKLTAERNERQARHEQTRLQGEINSYKLRLERADADLVHARRENLRLTEEVASLEKEINMNKIIEETRVSSQPVKTDKGKDEKEKDKELASLIFDLESKQAKTVASLEDTVNKQALLVSRLTAECQSLTQRMEANDRKHKQEMATLQSNIEYLSSEMKGSLNENTENLAQIVTDSEYIPSEIVNDDPVMSEVKTPDPNSNTCLDDENLQKVYHYESKDLEQTSGVNAQNGHQDYPTVQEHYDGVEYTNQPYQYEQYDSVQYQDYSNNQQYVKGDEYSQAQYPTQNETYTQDSNYSGQEVVSEDVASEQVSRES
ncbi:hypothetical protein QAD02_014603 [Eretmocerus hayati]|uniref:Uncharacterized protein n=1 Tax=Eretmocerus hayati TaxID=131215 RepID=A0ACC2P5U6_9HYME|nr:hypothetical protein QAD02_014603 [Eretmocerus hayati]